MEDSVNMSSWMDEETVGKIKERLAVAKKWSEPWHNNIKKWRELYDFSHYRAAPKNQEKQFSDPTYTNVVDLAVGILLANPVEFNATGWEPSAGEDEGTSHVEKFLHGALEIANQREDMHLPYEVNLNFVRDGGACLYAVWDPILAEGARTTMTLPDPDNPEGVRPMEGYTELPIRTQAIDPIEVFLIPGGPNRWQAVMRVLEMSVYDFESLYHVPVKGYEAYTGSGKMEKKIEFIDYWRYVDVDTPIVVEPADEELGRPETKKVRALCHAVLFNNEFVPGFEPQIAQGYRSLPYKVQFYKPTLRNDPKGFHSIIRPLETSVAMLEEAINRRTRQIEVYSSLPMFVKALAGRSTEIDAGFGNVPTLAPDEDIAFPQWPGNAPDVSMHIDFVRSRISQSGFSDVMYGSGSSEASGFALSLLGDQNRIRLEQPVSHLELLWSSWAKDILELTRSFANDAVVRVYGRMRGSDFAEQVIGKEVADYLVKAAVRPEFPNEKTRYHAMAVQVKGILSDYTIMERYLNVKQPEEEEERKLIQMAKLHPAMQQYGVIVALQELAEEGDKAAAMTLEQLQNGQISGAGGRPPEGVQPGNALGTQSATGEATPQAGGAMPEGMSAEDQQNAMANAAPQMNPSAQEALAGGVA